MKTRTPKYKLLGDQLLIKSTSNPRHWGHQGGIPTSRMGHLFAAMVLKQ